MVMSSRSRGRVIVSRVVIVVRVFVLFFMEIVSMSVLLWFRFFEMISMCLLLMVVVWGLLFMGSVVELSLLCVFLFVVWMDLFGVMICRILFLRVLMLWFLLGLFVCLLSFLRCCLVVCFVVLWMFVLRIL